MDPLGKWGDRLYLIVGLGNPKNKYSGTRHNLGFQVVETLARRLKSGAPVSRHWSLLAEAEYQGSKLLLAQPLTYMNRSGLAVNEIVRNYHLDLDQILVIYDDLDLSPGTIRLRKKGGGAGHRGVQSIIDAMGTEDFPRLRIGIGKPPPGVEASEYVLRPLTGEDREQIEPALDKAVEAALVFVAEGLETAMNNYNHK